MRKIPGELFDQSEAVEMGLGEIGKTMLKSARSVILLTGLIVHDTLYTCFQGGHDEIIICIVRTQQPPHSSG